MERLVILAALAWTLFVIAVNVAIVVVVIHFVAKLW